MTLIENWESAFTLCVLFVSIAAFLCYQKERRYEASIDALLGRYNEASEQRDRLRIELQIAHTDRAQMQRELAKKDKK